MFKRLMLLTFITIASCSPLSPNVVNLPESQVPVSTSPHYFPQDFEMCRLQRDLVICVSACQQNPDFKWC